MLYRDADDDADASADTIFALAARRAAATARGIKSIERGRCPGRFDGDGGGI